MSAGDARTFLCKPTCYNFIFFRSPNIGRIVGGDEIEVVEIEPQLSGQKEELPPPVPIDARVVIEVNESGNKRWSDHVDKSVFLL